MFYIELQGKVPTNKWSMVLPSIVEGEESIAVSSERADRLTSFTWPSPFHSPSPLLFSPTFHCLALSPI